MQCSKCDTENREGATFCDACGAAIEYKCNECGAEAKPHAKFCDDCGTELSFGTESIEAGQDISVNVSLPAVPSFDLATSDAEVGDAGASEMPAGETDTTATRPDELPASFGAGRYKVIAFVGEGAKKLVYRARDTRLDRDVAISLIKATGMSAHDLSRLKREAQAMAWLGDHPNVVTIYDLGDEGTQIYIVSQFMEGGDVAALLDAEEDERLTPERALEITTQIATALEHAHEKGIIHRDIKPENVWLTADGTAKLGDFGMAMVSSRTRITAAGMMIGTVSYMAPEIVLGKSREADARCDIYSLGAMLYEMLTGVPPFVGDMNTVISGHLNEAPAPPSAQAPGISPEIDSLVLWMLAKAPGDRPRSAQMLLQSIAAIRGGVAGPRPATVAAAIEGTPLAEEQVPDLVAPSARPTAVMPMVLPVPEAEPVPEPVTEVVPEVVPEAEPVPEPVTEVVPEVVPEAEPVPEPVTEVVPEVVPEPALEDEPTTASLLDSVIGRAKELDDLYWVLDETIAGRGRFVRINGEQGIGRSWLASDIGTIAGGKGARVFTAVCRSDDRPGPFHYWMPLIESLVDEFEVSKLRTDLGAAARELSELMTGNTSARVKLLEAGEGEPSEDTLVPGLTRMIRRLAASTPFVAVFDDIEWADEGTLRLVEELAHGASIISMLLIVTTEAAPSSALARDDLDHLDTIESKKTIDLKPLDQAAVEQLAGSIFGRMPRNPLGAALLEVSKGNPLEVTAAARALGAEGILTGNALPDEWRDRVPATLAESVERHLATFTGDARLALYTAALIGEEFNLALLAALTAMREPHLRKLLQAPVFAGLVVPVDGTFAFSHRLLRDAVLTASTPDIDAPDPVAWARWQSAVLDATRATMAGRFDEAEVIAEQAHRLGFAAGAGEIADQAFGTQIFEIRKQQGRLADVEAALEAITEGIADDPKWRVALAAVHLECGRHAEERGELTLLGKDGFAAVPEGPNRLGLLAGLAQIAVHLRDGEMCAELADLLAPHSGQAAVLDSGSLCEGAIDRELGLLADALARDDEAVSYLERAIDLNESLGAHAPAVNCRRELAVALLHRGRTGDADRAAGLLREAEAAYSALGLDDLAIQTAAVAAAAEISPPAESGSGASETNGGGLDRLVAMLKSDLPDLSGDAGEQGALTLVAFSGGFDTGTEPGISAGRVVAVSDGAMLAAYSNAVDALAEAVALVGPESAEASARCAAIHGISANAASGEMLVHQIALVAAIAASCSEGEVVTSAAANDLIGDARGPTEERFVELKGLPGSHRVFVSRG